MAGGAGEGEEARSAQGFRAGSSRHGDDVGSGLDPDISLKNAEYQRPTVVQGVVGKIVGDFESAEENQKAKKKVSDDQKKKLTDEVDKAVGELLKQQAYRPMWGTVPARSG